MDALNPIMRSLPYAVAVVLSAAPILAVVLLMVTTRPARVSTMFLVGWLGGILTLAGLLVGVVDLSGRPRLSETVGGIVRIVLGGILALLALRSWQQRGEAAEGSRLLTNIGRWSPTRAFAVGFGLGSVNPKNLALVASGATAILAASTAPRAQAVAVVVFAIVASLGVAIPIVLREMGGPAVNRVLERAAKWMTAHGKIISSAVLAIIALILVVAGLSALSG
jgi:Sap, sulfolipid-1-addressing protein